MSPFLAEFIGTMLLVILGDGVVANVLLTQSKGHNSGWMVITAVWGLGVAVAVYTVGAFSGAPFNPARDFGPRLAHFLLPIPGKGDSNWSYAWVPVVGPILGGVLGAVFYKLLWKPL